MKNFTQWVDSFSIMRGFHCINSLCGGPRNSRAIFPYPLTRHSWFILERSTSVRWYFTEIRHHYNCLNSVLGQKDSVHAMSQAFVRNCVNITICNSHMNKCAIIQVSQNRDLLPEPYNVDERVQTSETVFIKFRHQLSLTSHLRDDKFSSFFSIQQP